MIWQREQAQMRRVKMRKLSKNTFFSIYEKKNGCEKNVETNSRANFIVVCAFFLLLHSRLLVFVRTFRVTSKIVGKSSSKHFHFMSRDRNESIMNKNDGTDNSVETKNKPLLISFHGEFYA